MNRFDFYGYTVDATADSADVLAEVCRDFAYFVTTPSDTPADMRVSIRLEEPVFAGFPDVAASVITPRNVCFRSGDTTYVDYFGKGLAVVNTAARTCDITAPSFAMAREIAYLFLLSTVGQYLDARHLHRIHAMGASYKGRGILLLLPSGGGKSTMTMQLLKQPDFRLLSEDTPLIDRKGMMHPFPLRLGVKNPETSDIPEEYRHTFDRMEFDPKTFVDLDYFRHKIGPAVQPALVLVGERRMGNSSAIVEISRRRAFEAVVKYMVVGLGVYQGLEFLLERSVSEVMGKGSVAASRLRNGMKLLSTARAWKFELGRDPELNARTLIAFTQRGLD